MSQAVLSPAFYQQDTVALSTALIGCVLHRTIGRESLSGMIVETEAYLGANDPASHARRGLRSTRNESMYLPGGHAYVYFTYGMYYCMNVVAGEADIAEAVLIRAVEPLEGLDRMRANRPAAKRDRDLTNGPGKLCMAMEIDRDLDGVRLDGKDLFLTGRARQIDEVEIGVSRRIGIEGSGEEAAAWPLRFYLEKSEFVSRRR
ncbi:MAG: DNA-3-methyladenine glycosylase [Thermoanaerobaculia bacterium]|nr:DNA-3-methyladenine glycosylase [Thermoanaerobaculia bacterium]